MSGLDDKSTITGLSFSFFRLVVLFKWQCDVWNRQILLWAIELFDNFACFEGFVMLTPIFGFIPN